LSGDSEGRKGLAGSSREKRGRVFSQDLTLTMWRWKNKYLTNIAQYSIRLNPFTSKDFNKNNDVDKLFVLIAQYNEVFLY